MVTQAEKDLIRLLKSLGFNMEDTIAVGTLAKTDEVIAELIRWIVEVYREKGEVTKEEIAKMLLVLKGDKKNP